MTAKTDVIEDFGPYEFIRRIGQGGMSEVFLARQKERPNDPMVVVKRLHQELEEKPETVDLFLTEADVTLLLDHPNVVHVYDSGEFAGRYYIAMEYMDGADLSNIILTAIAKKVVIPFNIAFYITHEILKGLEYIHSAKSLAGKPLGIVHRDITPSNIWISHDGTVKLGDFGVAKLVGVESWTISGNIKGKLGYFTPEQMRGAPVTQTIDLYCAAIILYELLTRKNCYTGQTELEIMLKIRDAKYENPRKYRPDMPWRLKWFLDKVLNKHPGRRFADATAFLAALDKWIAKYPPKAGAEDLAIFIKNLANA